MPDQSVNQETYSMPSDHSVGHTEGGSANRSHQQQQQQQHRRQFTINTTSISNNDGNNNSNNNNMEASDRSNDSLTRDLIDWYAGKNILITGASGFIGKVCLEKVLRDLNTCGNIFVLIRSKKGLSGQQRLQKMLSEEPFRMNKINPELFKKVIAIEGDMSSVDLGLKETDLARLIDEVNVVFNIAASVQFDAPLKQNLRDNYQGSQNLLQLSSKFPHLYSYVHVSTFFTNSHLTHQEERVLPMNRDCEKMAELIKWIPDQLCNSIAPQIMENRPNTYIFTKAMSENLVQKYQGKFPISIVRPSIVVPSVKDPTAAWVDNINGPMGLGVLASLGILRTIDWNYWGVADFIPVDVVVNCMITTARRANLVHPKQVKVYNASTSSLNPLAWGECFESLRATSMEAPPYKMVRIPIMPPRYKRANKIQFNLTKIFSELLFAYFVDFILILCGQKRLLTKLTKRLHHGYEILRPFTTTAYTCSNDNYIDAYEELSPRDKEVFNFDVRKIQWYSLFATYYMGSRRFILKENPDNIPQALFKMKILHAVEFIFKLAFYCFIAWSSYKLTNYLLIVTTNCDANYYLGKIRDNFLSYTLTVN